jgi:hypothetical protein
MDKWVLPRLRQIFMQQNNYISLDNQWVVVMFVIRTLAQKVVVSLIQVRSRLKQHAPKFDHGSETTKTKPPALQYLIVCIPIFQRAQKNQTRCMQNTLQQLVSIQRMDD